MLQVVTEDLSKSSEQFSTLPVAHRLRADKIASSAAQVVPRENIVVLPHALPSKGLVVAAEVADDYCGENVLELGSGRLARLKAGDIIVGTLGERMALKGFVGRLPLSLVPGELLHVLNLGGVIGQLEGGHHGLAAPTPVRFLGAVTDGAGPLNLAHGARTLATRITTPIPLVLVAGTCMNAGKTKAAAELIGAFTRRGVRVGAAKLTGVACLRDLLVMEDLGAVKTLSFLDFGLPSTVGLQDIGPLAKGIINGLGDYGVDLAILELGDGILGGYGVESLFDDGEIMASTMGLVVCANDFLGAWGAIEFLRNRAVAVDVICGSATDSSAAVSFIEKRFGVPAANAVSSPEKLFNLINKKMDLWQARQH